MRPERFELPTYCSGGNRSIHLSYGRTLQVYTGEGRIHLVLLARRRVCLSLSKRSSVSPGAKLSSSSQQGVPTKFSNCRGQYSPGTAGLRPRGTFARQIRTDYQRPRPPPRPPRSPPRSPPLPPPRSPRSRPPPPACSAFGRASFTLSVRPPICEPFNAVMAFSPSSLLVISTKPKPRERPVSRSVMMLTRSTGPNGSKICLSSSSDVLKFRFPTKIFFKRPPLAMNCRSASSMRWTGRSGTPS